MMKLQNIVIPDIVDDTLPLYIRSEEVNLYNGKLYLEENETFQTDTYMNIFDIGLWKKYTIVQSLYLEIMVQGVGKIEMYIEDENEESVIDTTFFSNELEKSVIIVLDCIKDIERGHVWFRLTGFTELVIGEMSYFTKQNSLQSIQLSTIICTYKRKEQLEKNIEVIRQCKLLEQNLLQIVIVDNGQELKDNYGTNFKVYQNPNTGGSGGFKRGMEEVVRNLPQFSSTNVILMDDDVLFSIEIFHRIYAFLSFLKKEYEEEVIAGRMFRLDNPSIQYTAVEKWNKGEIIHIGGNQDMREKQNLRNMSDSVDGEYSGWWLAVFPINFIKENKPLPFFLHCDDVEFGLRHGGIPIIINGVHVWHETYEYRQSPVIAYYDMRNSLIVNAMYDGNFNLELMYKDFIENIKNENEEYRILKNIAIVDYLKGNNWFQKIDVENKHLELTKYLNRNKSLLRIQNWFLEKKLRKEGIYFGKKRN